MEAIRLIQLQFVKLVNSQVSKHRSVFILIAFLCNNSHFPQLNGQFASITDPVLIFHELDPHLIGPIWVDFLHVYFVVPRLFSRSEGLAKTGSFLSTCLFTKSLRGKAKKCEIACNESSNFRFHLPWLALPPPLCCFGYIKMPVSMVKWRQQFTVKRESNYSDQPFARRTTPREFPLSPSSPADCCDGWLADW